MITKGKGRSAGEKIESARVHEHTPPDSDGNMCSPVITCFESVAFLAQLKECAIEAEQTRARQQLVTQAPPQKPAGEMAPGSLFFDGAAREGGVQEGVDDMQERSEGLGMAASLSRSLNHLLNRKTDAMPAVSASSHQPSKLPAITPNLFPLPKGQQLVNPTQPTVRNDLVALQIRTPPCTTRRRRGRRSRRGR